MSSAFEELSKELDTHEEARKKAIRAGNFFRLEDHVHLANGNKDVMPPNDWVQVRFLPGLLTINNLWIDFKTQEGNTIQVPKFVTPDSPYMDVMDKLTHRGRPAKVSTVYYANVLFRDLQGNGPKNPQKKYTPEEAESGYKDPNSKSWSPVYVLRFPKTMLDKLMDLPRGGDPFSLDAGYDVMIKHAPDSDVPTFIWDAAQGDDKKNPITKQERELLIWNLADVRRRLEEAETDDQARAWIRENVTGGTGDPQETASRPAKPKQRQVPESKERLPWEDGDKEKPPKGKKKKGRGKKSK